MKTQNPTACRRCGTCCRKGGPSFHLSDKDIPESGKIPLSALYTIREGELARDNVRGYLHPQPSDIIKIKGRKNTDTCIFFSETDRSCTVYDFRPLECRVLNCRDTREIEKIYAENRLGRRALLEKIPGLWELVQAHQQQCDYREILPALRELKAGNSKISGRIGEIVHCDMLIREQVRERSGNKEDINDFLFGRSLQTTLRPLGLHIRKEGEKIFIRTVF
ncbi:MAG: YkgJ family cysteine cluster protein [Desulfococcaceae bacterium]|nr:YkgJ family cysteine cluster protein [Desulfococcaceae bacterium]